MLDYITSYLKSDLTPGSAGNMFWAFVYIVLIFLGLSVAVIAMNWLERKILAHMQVRLGPMRVGPHGLLQPIADALKLLIKEDIMPAAADPFVFWMAPLLVVITAFTVFIVVPFGPTHAVTDMNIGVLFMLGVSSLSVLGVVMAGWASNSHYPLMGALRSSAQMVSYEIAMGLAVISAVLMTSLNKEGVGTLSMIGIVQAQQAQHVWFVFKFFPLGLIAFVIFAIAMVAETNRAPFDLPEAESELTAGFHTEYSGFRWSLFFLAEYSAMIAVSSIAVTLWLGGWMRPFPHALGGETWDLVFSLVPGLTFLFLAGITFYSTARMPKHPYFKVQTIGLGGFGAVLALIARGLVHPGGARPGPGHFLVQRQSGALHVHVHLVSRHVPALPLRSINESRMESFVAAWNRRPGADGDRRNIVLNNGKATMAPVATTFFFYFLSAVTVLSGVLVITRKNPVHSALALIVSLLGQAALYLMLYAPFVAGVQIILYAGGIMVLFLFVIMLVNIEKSQKEDQFNKQWVVGLAAAIALGALFVLVYVKGRALFPDRAIQMPETSNTQQVAVLLYGNYMFTFEIASLLLLVAIIGAVVMAKKRI